MGLSLKDSNTLLSINCFSGDNKQANEWTHEYNIRLFPPPLLFMRGNNQIVKSHRLGGIMLLMHSLSTLGNAAYTPIRSQIQQVK